MSKVRDLEQAVSMVPDGATIAIGGLSMNATPMAFVRELIRQEKRDLTLLAIVNGMAIDWLVAAGAVRKVIAGLVSFEGLGLAPNFRRAVQAGAIEFEESSEHILISRLQAAARNLPFMPTKAGMGTDVLAINEGRLRVETDAATGEQYVAALPLAVDVAVVHVHEADEHGNARVNPKLVWMDSEVVNAATTTIVTTERIVPHRAFKAEPHRTTYPRFMVDAVVPAPWGAYPTSSFPEYTHDRAFYEEYVAAAAAGKEEFELFFKNRVAGPATHAEFIDANGGAAKIIEIRRRTS